MQPADDELVQMTALPTHGLQQNAVELGESDVLWNQGAKNAMLEQKRPLSRLAA